jgi:hypothetical protein
VLGVIVPVTQTPDYTLAIYQVKAEKEHYGIFADDGGLYLPITKWNQNEDYQRKELRITHPGKWDRHEGVASGLTDGVREGVQFRPIDVDGDEHQDVFLLVMLDLGPFISYVYEIQNDRAVPLFNSEHTQLIDFGNSAIVETFVPMQLDEDAQVEFAAVDGGTMRIYQFDGARWSARYDPQVERFFIASSSMSFILGRSDQTLRNLPSWPWRAAGLLGLLLVGALYLMLKAPKPFRVRAVLLYLVEAPIRAYCLVWIFVLVLQIPVLNSFVGMSLLFIGMLWPIIWGVLFYVYSLNWLRWARHRQEAEGM